MLSQSVRLLVVFSLLILTGTAGTPIATVMSGDGLVLNGIPVPGTIKPSLPLVSGDIIATTQSSAVILLQDHSRLILQKNSKIRLENEGGRTNLQLLQGAAQLSAVPGAIMKVFALGLEMNVETPFQGVISLEGSQKVQVMVAKGNVQVGVDDASTNSPPPEDSPAGGSSTQAAAGPAKAISILGMKPAVALVVIGGAAAATAVGLAAANGGEPAISPSRSPSQP